MSNSLIPILEFSWDPKLEASAELLPMPDLKQSCVFSGFPTIESPSETNSPLFIDIASSSHVASVTLRSNSRNIEAYNLISKQCIDGGELPPEWNYLFTERGIVVGDDPSVVDCSLCFLRVEKTHKIRLKLLSLKPHNRKAKIESLVVVMVGDNSKVGETEKVVSNKCSETSANSARNDHLLLRSMFAEMMLVVTSNIQATCRTMEAKIDHRMAAMEISLEELTSVVSKLRREEDIANQTKSNKNSESLRTAEEWLDYEVSEWLKNIGLERYAVTFQLCGVVDGPSLLALTAEDLEAEELGIEPLDAEKLLIGIRELKEKVISNSDIVVVPNI